MAKANVKLLSVELDASPEFEDSVEVLISPLDEDGDICIEVFNDGTVQVWDADARHLVGEFNALETARFLGRVSGQVVTAANLSS